MIGIVDYGVGNLFSLASSLRAVGAEAVVSGDADTLRQADRLILPGVGAFRDAAARLAATGLDTLVKSEAAAGKPLLGICLGMQLLFDESLEFGRWQGLGLIPGRVVPMRGVIPDSLKVPQIGWNALRFTRPSPLLQDIREGDMVYFVHSYYAADCGEAVIATADYGIPVTAAVQRENVFGCQFHPEKSGRVGLRIIERFAKGALSC